MNRRVGQVLLLSSAAGYPATQYVVRRFGRPGAVAVECVCAGLLARDLILLTRGTPRRLRTGPAVLLGLECVAAATATAFNAGLLGRQDPSQSVTGHPRSITEWVRRATVAALFGLHTIRFHIYLRPDQGRRTAHG